MYVPKYLKVSLPMSNLVMSKVDTAQIDEVKQIFKNQFKHVSKLMFRDDSNARSGFMKYHRGPLHFSGDHGYVRLACLASAVLNTVVRGRTVFNWLPIADNPNNSLSPDFSANETSFVTLYVTRSEQMALEYFARLSLYDSSDLRLLDIETLRRMVDEICRARLIDSNGFGATFFNILVFIFQLTRALWISADMRDDFNSGKAHLNLSYTTYDLHELTCNEEFESFFRDWVMSFNHTAVIQKLIELSMKGRSISLEFDGVKVMAQFFDNWVDGCVECFIEGAQNWYTINSLSSEFFAQLPKYTSYMRIKSKIQKEVDYKIKEFPQFNLITTVVDVDCAKVATEEFCSHFETEFSDIINLFCDFVDEFFCPISGTSFLPVLTADYAEIAGRKTIFGATASSPYMKVTYLFDEYKDGREFHEVRVSVPDGTRDRLRKHPYLIASKNRLDISDLQRRAPRYLEICFKAFRSYLVSKLDHSSQIYRITWLDEYNLLIPPVNPSLPYHFDDVMTRDIGLRDPEYFTIRTIGRDEISANHYLFIVSSDELERCTMSSDAQAAFYSVFEKNLLSRFQNVEIGAEHYYKVINPGRVALLSLSALLATADISASDNIVHYLRVNVDDVNLERQTVGSTVSIPKELIVPFPFAKRDLTPSQEGLMIQRWETEVDNRFISAKNGLLSDNICVDLDSFYHPFTDELVKGYARVRIGKNILLGCGDALNFSSDDYVFRINSLVRKTQIDCCGTSSLFGYSELDFYDPYSGIKAEDTIFELFASIVTDILLTGSLPIGDNVNYYRSCSHVLGIYQFIKESLDKDELVSRVTDVQVNLTWEKVSQLLSEVVPHAKSLIDVTMANRVAISSGEKTEGTLELELAFKDSFLNFISALREGTSFYWNSKGFVLIPLYFGCALELLRDKFYGRIRRGLDVVDYNDVRFIPVPPSSNPATLSITRQHIKLNLNIILHNTIGKLISEGVRV